MRRGYALILLLSVIGSWTPTAFGQYPYPYPPPNGPMPGQYMPPPSYGPMPPPGYYPQPMPQQQPPRVFVYGPLTAIPPDPTAPLPGQATPQQAPAKNAPTKAGKANDQKAGVSQVQLTLPPAGAKDGSPVSRSQMVPEAACGATCFDDICAPTPIYDFIPKDPVLPGHGHFIAEIGAVAFVPYVNPHTMYQTSNAFGGGNTTDFPRQADFGPSVQFGYIAHTGWGIRADFWYLHGDINETLANTNPANIISTPSINGSQASAQSFAVLNGVFGVQTPGIKISGPSGTLVPPSVSGADQYHFAQRIDVDVADIEGIKECHFLSTTFLFGAGFRYAHFEQAYAATRNNPGVLPPDQSYINALDRTDLTSISRFEGWGPTFSLELVQPIFHSNVSFYANLRASFLWGTENFQQSGRSQVREYFLGGGNFIVDNQVAAAQRFNRQVEAGEAEVGVQYGCYLGRRVYLYGRMGVSVQRWFNVGTPTTNDGNVEFFGGTAKIGFTF